MAVDLHNMFSRRGFDVLAFPCNQFAKQEPGSYEEICAFAQKTHKVPFAIFDKVEVNGDNAIPLYNYLKHATNGKRIEWNFAAFLCDQEGKVIQRFSPGPSFEAVQKVLEPLLKR